MTDKDTGEPIGDSFEEIIAGLSELDTLDEDGIAEQAIGKLFALDTMLKSMSFTSEAEATDFTRSNYEEIGLEDIDQSTVFELSGPGVYLPEYRLLKPEELGGAFGIVHSGNYLGLARGATFKATFLGLRYNITEDPVQEDKYYASITPKFKGLPIGASFDTDIKHTIELTASVNLSEPVDIYIAGKQERLEFEHALNYLPDCYDKNILIELLSVVHADLKDVHPTDYVECKVTSEINRLSEVCFALAIRPDITEQGKQALLNMIKIKFGLINKSVVINFKEEAALTSVSDTSGECMTYQHENDTATGKLIDVVTINRASGPHEIYLAVQVPSADSEGVITVYIPLSGVERLLY